jgi:hypothetical protein
MGKARLILALAGALAMLLAFALAALAAGLGPRHQRVKPSTGLLVTGSVKGLYPGAHRRLRLNVRNRLAARVRLTSLTVRVRDARWNCPAANLRVARFRGRLSLPAGKRRLLNLEVSMPKAAPDSCKGATFPLVFRARAVRP